MQLCRKSSFFGEKDHENAAISLRTPLTAWIEQECSMKEVARPHPGNSPDQTSYGAQTTFLLYGVQRARPECRRNFRIEAPVRDPRLTKSRNAMSELQLIQNHRSNLKAPESGRGHLSVPERELNSFIDSMTSLIRPGASGSLTELWLDELACMECAPESESFNWRSVSVSASLKLASRVIASQLSGTHF